MYYQTAKCRFGMVRRFANMVLVCFDCVMQSFL